MPDLFVTDHAVQRYRERVRSCSADEARDTLSGPVFEMAREIGAHVVILSAGHRAIIKGRHVVTVLPKGVHVFTETTHRRDDL